MRPHRRAFLVLSAVCALVLAACYGAAEPSAESTTQLVGEMTKRGAVVVSQASGDTGCNDAGLAPNAVHLRLTVAADPTPRDVYVFRFKPTTYDASERSVDACQAVFAASSSRSGGQVSRLDATPFRAFGDGWSSPLHAVIRDALLAAAVAGASPSG